jgi:tetratricopeptide (TPR) repeat protein
MNSSLERGRLLHKQRRYDLAVVEFRKALAEDPEDAYAMSMLALALTRLGRAGEAMAQAKAAIAAEPEMAFCYFVLTSAFLASTERKRRIPILAKRQERRRLLAARAFILEAVRLDPSNATYLAVLAAMELDFGEPMRALEYANKGLAAKPDNAQCANLRAKAQARLGLIVSASRTLDAALAQDPENDTTHQTSAYLNMITGHREQAVDHLTESARINPENRRTVRALEVLRRGPSLFRRIAAVLVAPCILLAGVGLIMSLISAPTWLSNLTGGSPLVTLIYSFALVVILRIVVSVTRQSTERRRTPTYDPTKLPPPRVSGRNAK